MNMPVYVNNVSYVTGAYEGIVPPVELLMGRGNNWFDAEKYLGKRGHRYFSESVKYTLAASMGLTAINLEGNKAGVFIGTNSVDRTTRKELYCQISEVNDQVIGAAYAPNCSVNIAAGAVAQKYRLKGPSFTFTGGGDASLMALWKAQKLLQSGNITSALIGQVESYREQQVGSGSIMWHLSGTKVKNSEVNSLAAVCRRRWVPGLNMFPDPMLPSQGTPIYVIGKKGEEILERFIKNLEQTSTCYKHVWNESVDQVVCADMRLFTILSMFVMKPVSGSVFVVSGNGHIFNFKLNNCGE